jgi:4-diphosphocytidyl-2-C-methyl-D-erythritol kinase
MKFLTIKAPAKINLVLEIKGRRPDGYHEIRTIMHTVALSDTLTFSPRAGGLQVTCNRPEVPAGEENLVYRAASLLAKEARLQPRVHIHIHKRIPLAAGLGGGVRSGSGARR